MSYNRNGQYFKQRVNIDDITAAMYFHVLLISETDEIKTIKTCLSCIFDLIENIFDVTRDEIKENIINGVGMFGKINKKCIKLGVL